MSEPVDEFAAFLRLWADSELREYCPLYFRVAHRLADEGALLARIVGASPREKIVPVLLFAAVKSIADREPASPLARIYDGAPGDPWPPFRDVLVGRFDEIERLLRTRRTQTNEVGRAAAILPALATAAAWAGRPLALVEIGSSAGLNLLFDRFRYDYGAGHGTGDPAGAVRIVCEVRGPLVPPIPAAMPAVATRGGIDLDPIDVRDDERCRWLEACFWPGDAPRLARLRAALELARRDPPRLVRASALERLPDELAAVPRDAVPCVLSTWMLAYLTEDERRTLAAIVERAGAERDVVCVTAEYPGISPWTPPARPPATGEGRGATLVGMAAWRDGRCEARALAWMHAHGAWIDWIDAASAGY